MTSTERMIGAECATTSAEPADATSAEPADATSAEPADATGDERVPQSGTRVGARSTRQRAAVTSALESVPDFRSAQELHDLLKVRGAAVGLSTVYRTLQALADAGDIDVLRKADGESVYRLCSTHHHHHLVCRACGATVEVEGPAVERWAATEARRHGYVDVTHTVEVFGTCAACAESSV